MAHLKIDYIEFSSGKISATTEFFGKAFGWTFVDYGPEYQALANAGIDGGVDGTAQGPAGMALVILKAENLEAAEKQVLTAGGTITKPIFTFPGGRRFHFREPSGVEIAVWSET
ncbi:MAG: VOC family protein [Alphaproteobacteria bacterium]|nr:VOC family protein [Alphaproteobacteria bacterium]